MAPTPAARILVPLDQDKLRCLTSLYILLAAINGACKEKNHVTYSSGHAENDSHLTEYQDFLCKLAKICDIRKGGDTVTALVALKGSEGPNYCFVSNNRKESELQQTKDFLVDLLNTVGRNPDNLNERPLKKRVLWKILTFNFSRVACYLKNLTSALEECIKDCRGRGTQDWDTVRKLEDLKSKADFPRDMESSPNAKPKFLCDCENLIKAIKQSRSDPIDQRIKKFADEHDASHSLYWCELRHNLGRLLSYGRATDVIINARKEWPSLLENFTVTYFPSSRPSRSSTLKPLASPIEVIQAAFLDLDISDYEIHIQNLGRYGLDDLIIGQLSLKSSKSRVHCEVHLHDNLVQQGKTAASDFWNNSKFIATSKPPCCLCHYYFEDPDNNDFQLRAPHMNLYIKWQLPEVYEDQGEAATRREEVMDNIIEQLQDDTLKILKEEFPRWKKNDSRTDSRTVLSAAQGYSITSYSDIRGWSSDIRMENSRAGPRIPNEPMTSFLETEGEDGFIFIDNEHGINGEEEFNTGIAR